MEIIKLKPRTVKAVEVESNKKGVISSIQSLVGGEYIVEAGDDGWRNRRSVVIKERDGEFSIDIEEGDWVAKSKDSRPIHVTKPIHQLFKITNSRDEVTTLRFGMANAVLIDSIDDEAIDLIRSVVGKEYAVFRAPYYGTNIDRICIANNRGVFLSVRVYDYVIKRRGSFPVRMSISDVLSIYGIQGRCSPLGNKQNNK